MRKIVTGVFFLFAISMTVTLNALEVKAQSVRCFNVSSRQGWQNFDLGGPYTRVVSVSGGWSVDARNYSRVGPRGHSEPGLEPYNQYKYDQGMPFGALLVDIPTDGYGYVWVQGSQQLPKPITRTTIRINDADNALGDNSGVLKVCFGR
jgi:hypothetical protein